VLQYQHIGKFCFSLRLRLAELRRFKKGKGQRSRANLLNLLVLGRKQLPVPLGDDFDGAVGHFYGRLIVNRVRRHW